MNSNSSYDWVSILQNTIYEYNIKYHRAINYTPVILYTSYNGFNVDSNLAEANSSTNFCQISENGRNEINNF